jgi:hypothetical protein
MTNKLRMSNSLIIDKHHLILCASVFQIDFGGWASILLSAVRERRIVQMPITKVACPDLGQGELLR